MGRELHVEKLEPVFLTPEAAARPTEYGKRWMERVWRDIDRHSNTIRDVAKLAEYEAGKWDTIEDFLHAEGVPTAITSGVSQYGMSHLIDHINGKTAYTIPAAIAIALATVIPTSTTTGATVTEATYTGYARLAQTPASWTNAATAATPSVATNASTITFGACTASTSTLVGFVVTDNATAGSGNALWYGTLTSVTISTTQTPPTIAAGAMSLSMTGT